MISIAKGALDLRDAGRSGSSDFLGAVECVTGLEHKKNNLPYQCLPWQVDGDGVERNNEEGGIDSVDLYTKTLQNAGRFQGRQWRRLGSGDGISARISGVNIERRLVRGDVVLKLGPSLGPIGAVRLYQYRRVFNLNFLVRSQNEDMAKASETARTSSRCRRARA